MRRWPGQRGSKRGWWIALLVVLLVLVAGRLAAPSIVKKVVTKSLHELPDGYVGEIESVDMRMLSAEVAMLGLRIVKQNGLVPVPFMQAKELVLGTVMDSWKPRTTLRMVEPNVSYVDASSEAKKQTGPSFDLKKLQKQLPFELIRVVIENGQMHFRKYETKPDLDAYATGVNVTWDKLVGCLPPGSSSCRSELKGEGTVLKTGKLNLKGAFDRSPDVRFHVDAALRNLRAASLSPLLKEYAKVDIQKGEVDLDARYDRRGKSHSALITPRLSDIEVVGSDTKDTRFFRELGLAAAAGYFERKKGKKAIKFVSRPSGESDFSLVDLPGKSADSQTD